MKKSQHKQEKEYKALTFGYNQAPAIEMALNTHAKDGWILFSMNFNPISKQWLVLIERFMD